MPYYSRKQCTNATRPSHQTATWSPLINNNPQRHPHPTKRHDIGKLLAKFATSPTAPARISRTPHTALHTTWQNHNNITNRDSKTCSETWKVPEHTAYSTRNKSSHPNQQRISRSLVMPTLPMKGIENPSQKWFIITTGPRFTGTHTTKVPSLSPRRKQNT